MRSLKPRGSSARWRQWLGGLLMVLVVLASPTVAARAAQAAPSPHGTTLAATGGAPMCTPQASKPKTGSQGVIYSDRAGVGKTNVVRPPTVARVGSGKLLILTFTLPTPKMFSGAGAVGATKNACVTLAPKVTIRNEGPTTITVTAPAGVNSVTVTITWEQASFTAGATVNKAGHPVITVRNTGTVGLFVFGLRPIQAVYVPAYAAVAFTTSTYLRKGQYHTFILTSEAMGYPVDPLTVAAHPERSVTARR